MQPQLLLQHLLPLLQKHRLQLPRRLLTTSRRPRKLLKQRLKKLKRQLLTLLPSNSGISFTRKAGQSCLFYVLKQLNPRTATPPPI